MKVKALVVGNSERRGKVIEARVLEKDGDLDGMYHVAGTWFKIELSSEVMPADKRAYVIKELARAYEFIHKKPND